MEKKLPGHVAIIMDGNGRWAKKRGLPKIIGHRAGADSMRKIMECARDVGVHVLTLYAFSTENWARPTKEIDGLMRLLEEYLDKERDNLVKHGIRFHVIGTIERFPPAVRKKLKDTLEATKHNNNFVLNLALNYGSRDEILRAARKIIHDARSGKLKAAELNEKTFSNYLDTQDIPDPDLLIRTSGEMRISNFLLWQISYAELYVTDTLWPDFGKEDFKKAIDSYMKRKRRFGG
jgi:undecaprenyl diphosphate synthase